MIYLAVPYTRMEDESFEAVTAYAGKLMEAGEVVYSPITHSHPIALVSNLPGSWDYWEKVDTEFISMCDNLIVLCLDGWERSTGVQAEIKIAESMGLPIEYHDEDGAQFYP